VPGPDVDEFAEPDRVIAALADRSVGAGGLLAVQHPHRTPGAVAAGLGLVDTLPTARTALAALLRTAYRPVADVVAPYVVDGPDGSAIGLLCMVDPAEVGTSGSGLIRHTEDVYPEVVAERAVVVAGLGFATSAAMLVPLDGAERLTATLRAGIAVAGDPAVSTVDSAGRRHQLWLLGASPARAELLAVAGASPVLVADGNHRVAAAAAAGLNGLLALVTAGPGLRIGAFYRVLTGTGLGLGSLAAAWRRVGLVVRPGEHPDPPEQPGSVVVRSGSATLVVELPTATAGEPRPRIDHDVVEEVLLGTALGLDPAGPHVRPLPAGRRPEPDADAVLMLAPVPFADVVAMHDAGRQMPRKSTYFTPKPRSGLLLADLA
jgi:hypothetical protein